MSAKRSFSIWTAILRLVGGLLIASGVGWIGYMLVMFVLMNLEMVSSWDIALTYWWIEACVTIPFAISFIAVGWGFVRCNRSSCAEHWSC